MAYLWNHITHSTVVVCTLFVHLLYTCLGRVMKAVCQDSIIEAGTSARITSLLQNLSILANTVSNMQNRWRTPFSNFCYFSKFIFGLQISWYYPNIEIMHLYWLSTLTGDGWNPAILCLQLCLFQMVLNEWSIFLLDYNVKITF